MPRQWRLFCWLQGRLLPCCIRLRQEVLSPSGGDTAASGQRHLALFVANRVHFPAAGKRLLSYLG